MTEWDTPWRVLVWTFTAACAFTLASAWAPALKALPVLTWLGFPAATAWGWVLAPALGYVGQVARPSPLLRPCPPGLHQDEEMEHQISWLSMTSLGLV